MKVLVMGGTLFNGLALVNELVAQGHDVTVCNRGRTEADIPDSVGRLVADRSEPDSVRTALEGREFDCVQDMTAYHPGDVELMADILRDRVGHYIFASSTIIYADSGLLPITESHPLDRSDAQIEYGLHKILCEDLLLERHADHGFPATIVPFSMVFGPHNALPGREQRMFDRLEKGRPILIPGDGTTLGQVGHVDDQASALEQMMGKPVTFGKRYNLTGDSMHTDWFYVDTFAEVVGVDPERVFIPHAKMDALWDGDVDLDGPKGRQSAIDIRPTAGAVERQSSTAAQQFQLASLIQRLAPNLHRWNANVGFSIERLKTDIGWAPAFSFPAMVEHTYEWYKRSGLAETGDHDYTAEDQILAYLRT